MYFKLNSGSQVDSQIEQFFHLIKYSAPTYLECYHAWLFFSIKCFKPHKMNFTELVHKHSILSSIFLIQQSRLIADKFKFKLLKQTLQLHTMSSYKILIEPAKSSKGICKVCHLPIVQDHLRVQVRDDSEFNQYINKHGGRSAFSGEGMSRGYIETQNGCISILKYFVHLECFVLIQSPPFDQNRFKLQKCAERHRLVFRSWLDRKNVQVSTEKRQKDRVKANKIQKQKKANPTKSKKIVKANKGSK